jgi:molybdate transport system substrate-binding protein
MPLYGVAAKEALQKHKLWDKLQSKLVMGENISQTAQFITSGSADVGIIAYSLAVAPDLKKIDGGFYKIDSADHNPLRQGFMITKNGMSHPMASAFSDYVKSSEGKAILKQYGFEVPAE